MAHTIKGRDPTFFHSFQVEEINKEKQEVKVLVSMFGRETSAEIEFANVQKVEKN